MTLQININAVIIIESQLYLNCFQGGLQSCSKRRQIQPGLRFSPGIVFFFKGFIYLYSFVRKHFVKVKIVFLLTVCSASLCIKVHILIARWGKPRQYVNNIPCSAPCKGLFPGGGGSCCIFKGL